MSLGQASLAPRRRERVVPYLVVAVALAAVGVAASVWRPVAPPVGPVDTDLDTFAPQVLAAVEAYRGPRYVVSAVATVLGVLVPAMVALTGPGRRLVARLAGPAGHSPLRAGIVALVVAGIASLAVFPLSVWARVVHDGAWGFRTQSGARWLLDWLLVSGGTWLATAVLAAVLVAAVRRWPRSWPYRLTLVGTLLAAAVVLVHPLVLQPLLLPSSPMPPGETREEFERLLAEQDAEDLPLHVGEASLRTTRVNALVVGVGPTERVVVYDTMMELPGDQIQAALAHELAHREHRDVPRGLLAVPAALLPALLVTRGVIRAPSVRRAAGARSPFDPRLLATVVALAAVLEILGSPVASAVSRRAEAAADHRAIEVTDDAASRVASARAFTVRDLAPPRGPAWVRFLYATHPTVEARIRAAVAQADAGELPTREELEERERDIAHPAVHDGPP